MCKGTVVNERQCLQLCDKGCLYGAGNETGSSEMSVPGIVVAMCPTDETLIAELCYRPIKRWGKLTSYVGLPWCLFMSVLLSCVVCMYVCACVCV